MRPLFQVSELSLRDFFNFPKMFGVLAYVDNPWQTRVLLTFEPMWNAKSTRKL
jgi:hypothetical protein